PSGRIRSGRRPPSSSMNSSRSRLRGGRSSWRTAVRRLSERRDLRAPGVCYASTPPWTPNESGMAYALIPRCPRSGQLGIGIASYSIAAGLYCDGALRANTGVTLTQGAPNPRNNYLAISLLAEGRTAKQALAELLANDSDCEYRQVAVVDRENQAAAYSGDRVRGRAGYRTGNGYAALGDMLAGEQVLDALVTGFEAAPQAGLDERLLAALEAASGAGGMAGARGHLPERSAALIVWGSR